MKLIVSPFRDCYHNIASEEFLAENVTDNIFLLYINSPSIIVGINQNTYAEINHQYVEENGIELVRRRSGGGAVYHDGGNLNFCFIMDKSNKSTDELFKEFTAPIIEALGKLGAKAEFTGRNDLTIDGKKFSGNAQWHTKERSIVHGTLLFDSDLTVLSNALKVNEAKFIGKAVQSVRSRVTNIKPVLTDDYGIDVFIEKIASSVDGHFDKFTNYRYSDEEIYKLEQLVKEKYGTQEWNFGKSPKFEFTKRFKYEKGNVEVILDVKNGTIEVAKIYGDFFGKNPNLNDVENALVGNEFKPNALKEALSSVDLEAYIDGLTADLFITALFEA